ncbi:MAG TPA: helix-turn-helix transcriptional regulator [Thermoanaerobaculia bacterium]|nr:helix-turn-helix transcriptional regulator [Thermoanaerobaculia bacterium]
MRTAAERRISSDASVTSDAGHRPKLPRASNRRGSVTWRVVYHLDSENAGWRVGDARDFLELSDGEAEFVEIKLALARRLRELREEHNWTQAEVARRVGSSQSRVAKMEAADATVSVDLLVRSLLAVGANRRELGRVVGAIKR